MSRWRNSCTPSLRLRACSAQLLLPARESQGSGEAEVEITGAAPLDILRLIHASVASE